ncbi:50S ribosomal protein L11 methyltransferase [Clostridium sp.]|uniref:50S ribosomal protein L11 methyltransferase n=1 Tax=Clostridium sp. TaxID=1506 RepID=UPI003F3F946D
MFVITYKVNSNNVDEKIELLQINDIFNVFYESPLEITTDDYGYGYLEKETNELMLKVAFEGEKEELSKFDLLVSSIIETNSINIEEINETYEDFSIPSIEINDKWVLASPDEVIEGKDKNKINFISQGAFGTGLHETTQDLLRTILTKLDLEDKSVLDIGTGSGILSITSSIIGASNVTALDIRDVKEEVMLNASLNGLYNIDVVVGDVLSGEVTIDGKFDWIYINIGGEETELFMDYIKNHLEPNGQLLVSGLVQWSYESVKTLVESYGFTLVEKLQTNEWVTLIFK